MSLRTEGPANVSDDTSTEAHLTGGSTTDEKPRQRGRRQPAHTLPSVNLLSPSSFEKLATRRLRRRFTLAAVVVVVLVAAAWGAQHLRVAAAEQLLRVEQGETDRLTQESDELLPVRALVSGVQQQADTVSEAMAREIYFSEVLEAVRDASPAGVQLDSVVVTVAPAPVEPPVAGEAAAPPPAPLPTESPCPAPDPFNTLVVAGCITLTGSATSRAEVGDLVVRLGEQKLFLEPFISTTTTDDVSRVTFNGSVGLSEKVFTERYADDVEKWLAEDAS